MSCVNTAGRESQKFTNWQNKKFYMLNQICTDFFLNKKQILQNYKCKNTREWYG